MWPSVSLCLSKTSFFMLKVIHAPCRKRTTKGKNTYSHGPQKISIVNLQVASFDVLRSPQREQFRTFSWETIPVLHNARVSKSLLTQIVVLNLTVTRQLFSQVTWLFWVCFVIYKIIGASHSQLSQITRFFSFSLSPLLCLFLFSF